MARGHRNWARTSSPRSAASPPSWRSVLRPGRQWRADDGGGFACGFPMPWCVASRTMATFESWRSRISGDVRATGARAR